MRTLLIIPLLFITILTKGQKFYVWCPKEIKIKPRVQFLEKDTIDIIFYDARTLSNKSKEKCETLDIESSLLQTIREAYPSATIVRLSDSIYFRGVSPDHITLKIAISGYHAAFGSDLTVGIGNMGGNFSYGIIPKHMWNAVTAYSVTLYNKGTGDKKVTDICKIDSHSNTGGHITAKNVLNRTYRDAVNELLLFIDKSLMP